MQTEHSFKKSYFFHFNRCMHCNKISVLKPVYKCTGCSKVSHRSCLDRKYTINHRLGTEKHIVNQKTQVNTKYNELGEHLEPNYLYNKLVIEKQHPISLMSEAYLQARRAEHKSLLFAIRECVLEPYTIEPMFRRFGQEPSAAVTEQEQSTHVPTQEISAEAPEPLVPAPETNLQVQEQSAESPELGAEARNAVASNPGREKPELGEPVSELSVKISGIKGR